jgi:hypothetical protein
MEVSGPLSPRDINRVLACMTGTTVQLRRAKAAALDARGGPPPAAAARSSSDDVAAGVILGIFLNYVCRFAATTASHAEAMNGLMTDMRDSVMCQGVCRRLRDGGLPQLVDLLMREVVDEYPRAPAANA